MFGGWDELCLNFEDCGRKEMGNDKFFKDVDCSMFTKHYYIQVGAEQIGVPKSKLQGAFLFSFLGVNSFFFFAFPISKFHHASLDDYEELQVQTHLPSCNKC